MPSHKPFQLASLLSLVFLRTQGTRDCEDTVITVDELASIPLFSTLAEKELEYGGVRSASRAAIVEEESLAMPLWASSLPIRTATVA